MAGFLCTGLMKLEIVQKSRTKPDTRRPHAQVKILTSGGSFADFLKSSSLMHKEAPTDSKYLNAGGYIGPAEANE